MQMFLMNWSVGAGYGMKTSGRLLTLTICEEALAHVDLT
jgi:hypothetical protein